MKKSFESNLLNAINEAMKNCWNCGAGYAETDDLEICAEWVYSRNFGFSVMKITVLQDCEVKFSYTDYGTETER